MNKKSVAAIIAFAVTFGFSAFLMSFFASPVREVQIVKFRKPSTAGEKILRLLEQDIRNGEQRNTRAAFSGGYSDETASDAFARYAEAVNNYADLSGSMDDSGLPTDFQIAWRKHMDAWREKANMLAYESREATRLNRLNELNFGDAYDLKNEEINSTWYEVLGVAGKYGAFPANAY